MVAYTDACVKAVYERACTCMVDQCPTESSTFFPFCSGIAHFSTKSVRTSRLSGEVRDVSFGDAEKNQFILSFNSFCVWAMCLQEKKKVEPFGFGLRLYYICALCY